MFFPVDRSIRVSAPHIDAHCSFSTSSSIELLIAEFPMFALIFTLNFLPTIMGSSSTCFLLLGMIALPLATSLLTNSGSILSLAATKAISSVMIPRFA